MKNKTLAQSVYQKIKTSILSLEYPPEAILQERDLAESLGVSRTPIREAIHRLSQEGWLRTHARKNIQVRSVSVEDLKEVFEVRRTLEVSMLSLVFNAKCHRHAADIMSDHISHMKNSVDNLYSFITSDQDFHSANFMAFGNFRFQKIWNAISEEMIWLGVIAMTVGEERFYRVLSDHSAFCDAVRSGQRREAKNALLRHLNDTEQLLYKRMIAMNQVIR
ncbi:MAG: GntR family transcriptional regulator [Aminobacterium sp.]|uniref:GntR family transcriptional regulator n=1 Tax=Aminobacterium sp. TaxID=1872491 RepID=UPI001BD05B93|nr:GntR family transcriptional regulator [Aminobacterium sp.]MEA4876973.1 GntR family transcriptional regulator [Aminobacterium sp.]